MAAGTSEILTSSATGATLITFATTSPLHTVTKDLYLIVEFLIAVGIIALLVKKTRMQFNKEYAALAVASFFVLLVVLIVPGVSAQLNTSRNLQISLIFLAPFAVIGGLAIVRTLSTVMRVPCRSNCENSFLKAFSIFLALFLLFTTGFVYAVAEKSYSTALPLNAAVDVPSFNDRELAGAVWLSNDKNNLTHVYADAYRNEVLRGFFLTTLSSSPKGAYVYLGTLNVQQGKVINVLGSGGLGGSSTFYENASTFTSDRSRIYDNSGAQIYY